MIHRDLRSRIGRRAQRLGVTLSPQILDAFVAYYTLLAKWNAKINLTSLPLEPAGTDQAIDRLLIEPVMAADRVHKAFRHAIDIGSGGGSPSLPLALVVPQLQWRLVESKTRKAVFLREAVRELGLDQRVRIESARYEELLSRPQLHEALDLITIRAVRVEVRILMTLQAFLKPGGQILLFRGTASAPIALAPPLRWIATYPLVDALGSRLVVMTKDRV